MAPKRSKGKATSKTVVSEGAPSPPNLTTGSNACNEIRKRIFSNIELRKVIEDEDVDDFATQLHGDAPDDKDVDDYPDDKEDNDVDDVYPRAQHFHHFGSNQIGQISSLKSSSSNSSSIRSSTSIQTTATTNSTSGLADPLPPNSPLTMCSTTPLTKKPKKDSEVSLDESFNAIHVTEVVEFKDLHFSKTTFPLIVLF